LFRSPFSLTAVFGRRCVLASALCLTLTLLLAPSASARKKKKVLPTLTVSVSPSSVNEGDVAIYTISASKVSKQTLVVNYAMSGTAGGGSDYTLSGGTARATLPAAQTSITVAMNALGDGISPEPNESATMTLLTGSGYKVGTGTKAPAAMATIVDLAPPALYARTR
jgi:hypothetical protein